MISELERRGASELAKRRMMRGIDQTKGSLRALARVLGIARMTVSNYIARYDLDEYVLQVRAIHNPGAGYARRAWDPEYVERIRVIREEAGLPPFVSRHGVPKSRVILGGNKKDLA